MFGETPKKIGHFVLKFRFAIIVTNILLLVVLMMAMVGGDGVWMKAIAHMVSVAVLCDEMMFAMRVMSCVPAMLCVGVLVEGTW